MSLTPRERVLKTIDGKEPDRVPVDLGGTSWSISVVSPGYNELCTYLGFAETTIQIKPASFIVREVDEKILKNFGIDSRHIVIKVGGKQISNILFEDLYGVLWKSAETNFYPVDPPLKDVDKISQIEGYPKWPGLRSQPSMTSIYEKAKYYFEKTDFAVTASLEPISIFHRYAFLRGFIQMFVDIKKNFEFYSYLINRIYETGNELIENFLDEVADYVQIICIEEDMGAQGGPFLGVRDFRRYMKPWLRRRIQFIRRLAPKARVLLHSCGSVYDFIPDFIDLGIDILNPIQPLAAKMDAEKLKKVFGGKICFHGGVDVQKLLPLGTIKEVEENVKKVINILAPGGGYILAPSHHLRSVPPENINEMYLTALKYGKYSINI